MRSYDHRHARSYAYTTTHSTSAATAVNFRLTKSGAAGRLPCRVSERNLFGGPRLVDPEAD
ncbi:hypothetical protein [Nonomuraea sp. B5E05]|uniref:hypothetical protein n=1 Tax=Nonomuraea sp. B5E05 TaxID=3153569 RepID=UPI0032605B61